MRLMQVNQLWKVVGELRRAVVVAIEAEVVVVVEVALEMPNGLVRKRLLPVDSPPIYILRLKTVNIYMG